MPPLPENPITLVGANCGSENFGVEDTTKLVLAYLYMLNDSSSDCSLVCNCEAYDAKGCGYSLEYNNNSYKMRFEQINTWTIKVNSKPNVPSECIQQCSCGVQCDQKYFVEKKFNLTPYIPPKWEKMSEENCRKSSFCKTIYPKLCNSNYE